MKKLAYHIVGVGMVSRCDRVVIFEDPVELDGLWWACCVTPSIAVVETFPRNARTNVLQGKEISKHYLRRLRTAVFSMEGSASQRLRDKVMSEMVLPRYLLVACSCTVLLHHGSGFAIVVED